MTKIFDRVLVGNSLDELLYKGLKELKTTEETDSRLGDKTKEILGMNILLNNPKNIWMLNESRKHNIFHQIFESLHVLVGNNKLSHLARFLPNCKDFSDNWDGTEGTWRAGYGQRIRWFQRDNNGPLEYYAPDDYVDQWRNVVNELKVHPNSRRAVIVLWDPMEDGKFPNSLDYPCNDMIQFLIRNNKLNMIVTQRSSDIIWGYSAINQVEFSLMMQLTASVLGCDLGTYRHQMGSFHIYDRHYERMNEIINEYESGFDINATEDDSSYHFEKLDSFDLMDNLLGIIYGMEIKLRELGTDKFDEEYFNFYLETVKKYPNIGATFSIPLIHKRDLNDWHINKIVDFINSAKLHPALKVLFNRKLEKMHG